MSHRLEHQDAATREALVALGSVFLELRRSRGLTQRRLAARSGLSQSSISRLETGKAPWLSALWIARLLAGLDRDASEHGFASAQAPAVDAGWHVLMRRFDAARRRRELQRIDETRRADRERAQLDLAGELRTDPRRTP